MSGRWLDALLFILASPIVMLRLLLRARGHLRVLRVAVSPTLPCECGSVISLVGLWRCSCGFTYRGHLFRVCQICGGVPRVVRCYRCGVTTPLPEA